MHICVHIPPLTTELTLLTLHLFPWTFLFTIVMTEVSPPLYLLSFRSYTVYYVETHEIAIMLVKVSQTSAILYGSIKYYSFKDYSNF